jgi:DNA-binding SARP family transcriptional activator
MSLPAWERAGKGTGDDHRDRSSRDADGTDGRAGAFAAVGVAMTLIASVTGERFRDIPSFEIEVAILGPTEIRGIGAGFSRASALELVVYLALHPAGTANDTWATALWPDRLMAPATLHSTASAARRALGHSSSGLDHLPRSHGRLRLAPTVTTDWQRFIRLAASPDPGCWTQALGLVRGRPFEGLRNAEWTVLEGFAAEVEERVAELAGRVADDHLDAGQPRAAATAARRGLLVSPYDERLYRRLLVCADQEGHPAGVERVMAELLSQVDVTPSGGRGETFDLAMVHPKTASLYRTLSRRRRPEARPMVTRQ